MPRAWVDEAWRAALIGALLLACAGCLIDIDLSLLDGAVAGGASDAQPRDGGDLPTGCAADMVELATGCIDATEVSRRAYGDFLARGAATVQPIPSCRWNTQLTPESGWPPAAGTEDWPVGSVDWCDALAYCTWRGKRLCGGVGGAAVAPAQVADPQSGEWAAACGGGSGRAYPYGDSYSPGACRGAAASPVAVGTSAGCEGGYPGIRDLGGNVAEWQDACEDGPGSSGTNDMCVALGGGFDDGEVDLSCASTELARRSSTEPERGFRCCDTP